MAKSSIDSVQLTTGRPKRGVLPQGFATASFPASSDTSTAEKQRAEALVDAAKLDFGQLARRRCKLLSVRDPLTRKRRLGPGDYADGKDAVSCGSLQGILEGILLVGTSMEALRPSTALKTYRRGTHRTIAPKETIALVRPAMTEAGITRVANLTGLDRTGIPVVMVCRPNARSSAVFHGKGIELAAAKVSGIMEAIETWHAEHVALPLRLGSANELRNCYRLIDADRLARTPEWCFHPELPILWIEGRCLASGEAKWLPFETVHANGTLPNGLSGGFAASTNGLASGNHVSEATSHAICEVIERDALSLWHRLDPVSQAARRLDLSTVDDELCAEILAQLRRTDFAVAIWDITSDVGVSAFHCLLLDPADEASHVGLGAGCNPAREIALLRAITEAAQVRTTYIVGSREDIEHGDYQRATRQSRVQRARLLMRPSTRMRDFGEVERVAFDSFDAEVAWLVKRLQTVGIEDVIVVDLTRPQLGVPVVRAVIPGLEGSDHHAAYVPGARALAIERCIRP